MRMIDADMINMKNCPVSVIDIPKWINEQPTAYDIDEIMRKLADTFDKWGLDDDKKNIVFEIIKSGEKVHNCKNCTYADYMAETNRVYCVLHSCVMTLDNCCRDWEDDE